MKLKQKKDNHDENVPEEDDQDEDNSLMLLKTPMTCTGESSNIHIKLCMEWNAEQERQQSR
jgi:hypothetical protein